ncbi:MAG: hypothetical protein D6680_03350 [Cyanobacteria bacterium J007]|nr:MAG: hypothetical protein D6680_03350 [Cyanobacteria bacterium J007]
MTMGYKFLSAMGIAVNMAFFPLTAIAQEIPSELSEGMPYSEARELILEEGWQAPDLRPSNPLNGSEDYQEIENCSGTGVGYCRGYFVNADGDRLVVITVNGSENPDLSSWWIETEEE